MRVQCASYQVLTPDGAHSSLAPKQYALLGQQTADVQLTCMWSRPMLLMGKQKALEATFSVHMPSTGWSHMGGLRTANELSSNASGTSLPGTPMGAVVRAAGAFTVVAAAMQLPGSQLAAGTMDGRLRFIDADTGTLLPALHCGPAGQVVMQPGISLPCPRLCSLTAFSRTAVMPATSLSQLHPAVTCCYG